MKNNYNFICENTVDLISLHDCNCTKTYYFDNALTFEMDWIEILSAHPLNPYGKAHQTDNGKLVFCEPEIIKCTFYENDGGSKEIKSCDCLNFDNILLLQCEEKETCSGFKAKIYFLFNKNKIYDSAFLEMEYKKSILMWNEFKELSWFEYNQINS